MQPRVTAILVAHQGSGFLERTLAALEAQTRRPDVLIAVHTAYGDETEKLLSGASPTHLLTVRDGTSFGDAVTHAVRFAPPAESESEWLWLLGHDNAPEPDALAALLGAVEIAPSVSVAGPKLMRHDRPDTIAAFGETLSRFGASVQLVQDELDQAQHDTKDDVLGVAAAGMLVRRSLWHKLAGFDPGLPSIDASLDFSVRARLAGHRVVLVPGARVASAGGPESFGRRRVSDRRRFRIARAAQLHRRLVYAPPVALVLHWLSLLPLAVLRSIGDLVAKHPSAVGGEFRAAFRAAFTGRVGAARGHLRRSRRLGWGAIAPLRMSPAELRERRAQAREAGVPWAGAASGTASGTAQPRAGFVAHGGLWIVLLTAVVGLLAYAGLIGATALSGGGLLPLAGTPGELWSKIGYGWREIGTGFVGAADPFTAVLAVLGSLTWWAPSFSVVLVWLTALPLAALAAWFAARPLSRSPWLPTLAALLWAFSPPLLSALADGRIGAVLAHLLLPWLFLAALSAARSWSAGASAALLLAAVGACAPSTLPALLVLFVVLLAVRPGSIHRMFAIPVPVLVLFAPLLVQQVVRGTPLAILADPGPALAGTTTSGWRLALADATGTLHGWPAVLDGFAIPGPAAPVLVAVLLAPLGVLALLALFLPGARRAVPALVIALLGYLTAVAAAHLQVATVGAQPVTVWTGAGLSLFWLGLLAAALVGLDALARVAGPVSVLAGLTTTALVLPLLGAFVIGTAAVQPSNGRILPALVTAEAAHHPGVGTLLLASEGEKGISARLERGAGASLDDQSTLAHTTGALTADQERVADLAGNLASRSGYDEAKDFRELDILFVVVAPGPEDDANRERMIESLGANELLTPVGTTANGLLWRYDGETEPVAAQGGNTGTVYGRVILWALGLTFGIAVLLALPIGGRRRLSSRGDDDLADEGTEDGADETVEEIPEDVDGARPAVDTASDRDIAGLADTAGEEDRNG
jgi:GT2 family glycosyltransferase